MLTGQLPHQPGPHVSSIEECEYEPRFLKVLLVTPKSQKIICALIVNVYDGLSSASNPISASGLMFSQFLDLYRRPLKPFMIFLR